MPTALESRALLAIQGTSFSGHGPLYAKLADSIAQLVASGELAPGSAMPRVRDLAQGLDVSIVTAAHAYRVLGERGILSGRPGVGTFVAQPPSQHIEPPPPDAQSLTWQESFVRHRALSNLSYIYRLPSTCGHAAWNFFSVPAHGGELLAPTKRAMRRIALDAEIASCHPTDTQGLPGLRDAIALHLHESGVETAADRILITNSYEEALVLALLAFCREGDAVAMEDPSQFCLVDAVRLRGLRLLGVPMDDKGMRTEILATHASREPIRMVIVSPRSQNPTGLDMGAARRQQLCELANRHNWLIFECDPFAALTYRGRAQPPLFCSDRDGRVIYARPLSRGLLMNLGVTLATGRILEQLIHAKDVIDRGSDVFLQLLLKRLFEGGSVSRQDALMRRQWGDQISALLGALERTMPQGVRWTRPRGGGSVWVTMPEGCSAETLLGRSLEKGISFIPGRAFAVSERQDRSFRLAIGSMTPAQIMEGVKRLAAVLAQYVVEAQRNRARAPIARVS